MDYERYKPKHNPAKKVKKFTPEKDAVTMNVRHTTKLLEAHLISPFESTVKIYLFSLGVSLYKRIGAFGNGTHKITKGGKK